MTRPASESPGRVLPDAEPGNWVDRHAPAAWRPYAKLARFDRPIGSWLLMFPCWWSLALAEMSLGRSYPGPWHLLLFLIGAFVMRGAGCAFNDFVDRDIDGKVARTAGRPIPSGQVTPRQALAFAVALCLVGLSVLLQFNWPTVLLGASSVLLVAIYPFFKRFTYWPQVMLGLTFKWGALVGWSAVTGSVGLPALLLYAGSVLWTIGYDTIYAHQDKEDDLMAGLRSTALRFGDHTAAWVSGFYVGAVLLWAGAIWLAGAGVPSILGLAVVAAMLGWQVATLDTRDSANCLRRFKANRDVGWVMFGGLVADMAVRGGAAL
jgi:4-hydroxybenzoate polyprenyltransferase